MNIIQSCLLKFLLLTLVTGHSIIAAFTEAQAPPAEPPVPVTLFFASDYQYLGDWPYPEDTLRGILETVEEDGKDIDGIFYCGDYSNIDGHSNYEIDPDEYIDEIKEVIYDFVPEEAPVLFVQGNHDILTDEIADSGLHEYDSYLVYVLNTQTDNPWKQGITEGSKEKVEASAAALKACLQKLIGAGETRPVFVAADQEECVRGCGFCIITETKGSNILQEVKELYIDDICVDRHSRGTGCGSVIYEAIEAYARDIGCYHLILNVWAFNETARSFYEAKGMKMLRIGMETIL